MIKKLRIKIECQTCGTIKETEREIVIDEYTKKIDVLFSKYCPCGNRNKFKILDINLK